MVIERIVALSGTPPGGKYAGVVLLGTPSQPFDFEVENGVQSTNSNDHCGNAPRLPPRVPHPPPPAPPTPPHTLQVLSFTNTAGDNDPDAQPIICDGFSSTGDAKVSGNPSGNIEIDEGNDAGAAAGAVIAVIVARRVGSVVLVVPQPPHPIPLGPAGRFGRSWVGRQRVPASHVAPSPT